MVLTSMLGSLCIGHRRANRRDCRAACERTSQDTNNCGTNTISAKKGCPKHGAINTSCYTKTLCCHPILIVVFA